MEAPMCGYGLAHHIMSLQEKNGCMLRLDTAINRKDKRHKEAQTYALYLVCAHKKKKAARSREDFQIGCPITEQQAEKARTFAPYSKGAALLRAGRISSSSWYFNTRTQ